MPLEYESPRSSDQSLKQGEVLTDVWEHIVTHSTSEIRLDTVETESEHHLWVIVMNSYCDLVRDYDARNQVNNSDDNMTEELPQVILCDAFTEEIVRRAPGINGSIWRQITTNQKTRYHHLPASPVSETIDMPSLTLDFRKLFGVRTKHLYEAITAGSVERRGSLPDLYREDLIHRYASFQGRVSLPDDNVLVDVGSAPQPVRLSVPPG